MRILHVSLKSEIDDSYDIVIGSDLLWVIPRDLKTRPVGNRYAIITDSNVRKIYGENLLEEFRKEKIETYLTQFSAGEQSKNLDNVAYLAGELAKNGLDRKSAIIALGGGVVGDIAGFTASIYMRGIPYVQVPTTLLAQVDSSIGGKTAVDTPEGKNLIGLFSQPKKVYIDPNTLETLTEKDFRNGMAEVIKYGVIYDRDFFDYLEKKIEEIKKRDRESLMHIVMRSCKIKKKIVEEDPRDENKRAILNYGHTPAHAIEKLTGYKVTHGEAVAIGMDISGQIAVKKGFWSQSELEKQRSLLEEAGFDLRFKYNVQDFIRELYRDKKTEDRVTRFVLPERIGKMAIVRGEYRIPINELELTNYLSEILA